MTDVVVGSPRRWFMVVNLRILPLRPFTQLSLVDAIDACKELVDAVEELAAVLDVRGGPPRSCVDD